MADWWTILMPVLKKFEGFRAAPYRDQAGFWTIGYGTKNYPNGAAVTPHDLPVSEDEATSYLYSNAAKAQRGVFALLRRSVTESQMAAMVSLVYNIGIQAFSGSSVLRDFNAGDMKSAADAFLMWDKIHVNGQLVFDAGLLGRRQVEVGMFNAA